MNIENLDSEIRYQHTMAYVRQLKKDGIISDSEYNSINKIMLKKYKPVIGMLIAGEEIDSERETEGAYDGKICTDNTGNS